MPTKKRIQREDILKAAVQVIRREGPSALTMRRIAAQVGCSTQPLYSEFGGPGTAARCALRVYSRAVSGRSVLHIPRFRPAVSSVCRAGKGAVLLSLPAQARAGPNLGRGCQFQRHFAPAARNAGDQP